MDLKANFQLLRKNADKPTSIRLHVYSTFLFPVQRRLIWATGHKVHPALWNFETHRPYTSGNPVDNYIRRHNVNKSKAAILKTQLKKTKQYLDNVEVKALAYLVEHQNDRPLLSGDDYRTFFNETFRGLVAPTATISGYCETMIKEMQSGKRRKPKTNQRYTDGTIANYIGFLNVWRAFEKQSGVKYTFDAVTLDTYNKFTRFCEIKPLTDSHGKARKDTDGTPLTGLAVNTIGRHVSKWKVVMETAKDEGIHTNDIFRAKAFVALTEDTDGTYLKQSELDRLYKFDFSDNPRWEQVRDVFVVGCYTAQRVSDYARLSSEMLTTLDNGRKALTFIQKKGKNKVVIPAHPVALEILDKYNGTLPNLGKNPSDIINGHIKAVCEAAGINERYVSTRGEKGRTVERSGPKWEFVASHTARRTGITLMHLAGMGVHKIAEVSGHKDVKQLQKYIKASKAESAEVISGNSFFAREASPLKAVKHG